MGLAKKPSNKVIKKCLKDNPEVVLKTPQAMDDARAHAQTEAALLEHFDVMKKSQDILKEYSGKSIVEAHQMGNCDEKGVVTRKRGKKRVIGVVKKSTKAITIGDTLLSSE